MQTLCHPIFREICCAATLPLVGAGTPSSHCRPTRKSEGWHRILFQPAPPLHNNNREKKTLTTPTSVVIGSDYGKYLGMIFCRTSHTGEALFYPTRSILVNLLPSCLLSPNQDQYKLNVRFSPLPTKSVLFMIRKIFHRSPGKKGFSHRVLASILLKIYISRRVRVYVCVCFNPRRILGLMGTLYKSV